MNKAWLTQSQYMICCHANKSRKQLKQNNQGSMPICCEWMWMHFKMHGTMHRHVCVWLWYHCICQLRIVVCFYESNPRGLYSIPPSCNRFLTDLQKPWDLLNFRQYASSDFMCDILWPWNCCLKPNKESIM